MVIRMLRRGIERENMIRVGESAGVNKEKKDNMMKMMMMK